MDQNSGIPEKVTLLNSLSYFGLSIVQTAAKFTGKQTKRGGENSPASLIL